MSKQLDIMSATSPESEALIREYLRTHRSGVLGTADTVGNPYVAVIYYTVEDDLCLVFATKAETQKARNMIDNPHVAFAIYDEAEQTTIQATGRVERNEDESTKRRVIAAMSRNSAELSRREVPPADKLDAGNTIVFTFVPQVIRMGIFARPVSSEEEYYETLLFSE